MDTNDIKLTGMAAFVTGGGGGIGRASALCLADMGADVAVVDIIPERCEQMVAEIERRGGKALGLPVNVMEVGPLQDAVARAADAFGRMDVLVNNAGGVTRRPFLDLQEKNWRRHIDLNLISNLAATQAAVPVMIRGGRGGSVINVSSIEGSRAAPGYAVYAACKAGINNLTRTLALEFAEHGIRVNTIAPDFTRTSGTNGQFTGPIDESQWPPLSESALDSIRRRIPLGRTGLEEECGKVVAFLASSLASYVTGTIIPVDGGSWASSGWVRNANEDWVLPPEIAR
ncbi:NAD(P)-dependent dehydrogenase (short-subunit alcohol dehydrogenase family) [Novosphingobium chloroacetimidivorans]|uniref:NAD(P)-dependent dehydrogenase (Short-subunit alcohol dehydrogenase family) n=1 Tax=Novosphingobium chloroacetimidivorans TaxID=1428314 RepID=A0A7W7NVZ3_9SPHN|nr:SDR family oxidoreductase [Novosphingobium chloroacetimidivorans]MBB4858998.1 NAD(P)-dependent dehydrogenase (short-subunit alcohol dehydrogenase family) [Novosphingobium chloroacetimidivorans]